VLRLLCLSLCGMQARMKFYTAWKLAEGACVMTGLGWNGETTLTTTNPDGTVSTKTVSLWNRVSNVNPSALELTTGWNSLTRNWNINTQSWLENHIYRRCVGKDMRPTGWGMLVTYAVSSFWHGFYPGYYRELLLTMLSWSRACHVE